MSSADSILNSSTAIFVKDFYEEYIVKAKNNFKNSLKIARISSFTLGASGILLALILPNIIDLLLLTYSLWAPSIILPVIVGIFTKRTSKSFNNLIFIVMIFSAIATIIFMNTDYKYAMQPSVFGVVFSIIVFFIGKIVIGKKLIIE
jgi:SSS family solute:Na+ symporter